MTATISQLVGVATVGGGLASARSPPDFGAVLLLLSAVLGFQGFGLPAVHVAIRPALGGVGAFLLSSERGARPALVLHAAAVACVATTVESDSAIRFVNEATALVAAAFVYGRRLWPTVEGLAIACLIVAADDATNVARASHLTWWGIALLGLYDLCGESARKRAAPALLVIASVIALGVLFMSASGCGMLESSFSDYGPLTYAVGNFAMHYYPLIRAVIGASSATRTDWPVRAAAVVALYGAAYSPTDIYSCDHPPAGAAPPTMIGVALVAVAVASALPAAQRGDSGVDA